VSTLYYCTFISIFFFFQAEDGIRDRNVTGVQTCALPILPGCHSGGSLYAPHNSQTGRRSLHEFSPGFNGGSGYYVYPMAAEDPRSEERRVGKECRSRWSADH